MRTTSTAAVVLAQFGLHATWYIPSGLVGTPGYMTWDQLQTLQAAGHEIGGHSLDHTRLDGLSDRGAAPSGLR